MVNSSRADTGDISSNNHTSQQSQKESLKQAQAKESLLMWDMLMCVVVILNPTFNSV